MRRQLIPAVVSMVIFTVLLGLAYPLLVTGIAQAGFKDKADGSLIEKNGKVIGSSMHTQPFTNARATRSGSTSRNARARRTTTRPTAPAPTTDR